MGLPRIVVLDHTAQTGGAELAMLRVLAELRDIFEIVVVTFADGPLVAQVVAIGIPVRVVDLAEFANSTARDAGFGRIMVHSLSAAIRFIPRLREVVKGLDAQLVVANSLKAALAAAVVAPSLLIPWVWHLHDRLASDYMPKPLAFALRILASWGPRMVIVNSKATLSTLQRRARGRAVIAYPGVAADAFVKDVSVVAGSVVGMLGRISPTKGQREFLEAVAAVAPVHPEVTFRIVGAAIFGEQDYETRVRNMPAALGIADRVEFTGWVTDPGQQLQRMSVFVHASGVPEPFGQVVVEAMAAGVPVIASAAGGVLEILDPAGATVASETGWQVAQYGVLFRPGDAVALAGAMSWVLENPEYREALALSAQQAARKRFSVRSTAGVVVGAWNEVVGLGGCVSGSAGQYAAPE